MSNQELVSDLPTALKNHASWLVNAGAEDTRQSLSNMTGTDDEMRMLRAAIATEKSREARPSRLKPMEAKLRKFATFARTALLDAKGGDIPMKAKPQNSGPHGTEIVKTSNVEVVTVDPWERPRQILDGIRLALRMSVAGQVILGRELSQIKKDGGFTHGSAKRFAPSGQNVHLEKTWPEIVKENLGISSKTADRMIESFEAAKARLKKISHQGTLPGGAKRLELLFAMRPTGMTADDREALAKAVDKLVDGDTQRDLLAELKIIKAHVPLTGGDTSMHRKDKPSDEELMAQQTFRFFNPIADALQAFRRNADREAFLYTIALHSPDEETVSLTTLERDLEAALHDVRAARKARMKPATGSAQTLTESLS